MDKILSECRRQLGDFEVIEWVDEDKLADLRSKLDVTAPMDLQWTRFVAVFALALALALISGFLT